MNCIIVDDERPARELLEDNIKQIPFLKLLGQAKNAAEALDMLNSLEVDLMFLDIQMPAITGLQFLGSLRKPPLVIMVTAFEQHALEGFELEVIDYLVKPVPFPRFAKAVQKASELYKMKKLTTLSVASSLEHVFVNANYSLLRVMLDIPLNMPSRERKRKLLNLLRVRLHWPNRNRELSVGMHCKWALLLSGYLILSLVKKGDRHI